MRLSVDELIKRLAEFERKVIAAAPKITMEMAQNTAALSIRRLQKEGIPGKRYSTKPMLATRDQFNRIDRFKPTPIATLLGRDDSGSLIPGGKRTKKGTVNKNTTEARVMWIKFKKAKKAVPVMILPGGYEELRKLNGLQTAHVDLTFSGRMTQNVKVLDSKNQEFKFYSFIGVTQAEEKAKLRGNRDRYGPFLDPTEKEIEIIKPIPFNRIEKLFKETFDA